MACNLFVVLSYPTYTQPLDFVIDQVRVRIGEEEVKFDALPSNATIHTYNGGSVIVSDSKDAIMGEVENAQRTSKAILESVPYHERMVESCGGFMRLLNPELAENAKRDEKLVKLENDLFELKQMLSAALGKSKNN